MALAGESTLERELVCLAATTAERRPSLFGARMRFEFAAAAVLGEMLGSWARCSDA